MTAWKHITAYWFEWIATILLILIVCLSASGVFAYLDGRGDLNGGMLIGVVLLYVSISLSIFVSVLIVIRFTAKEKDGGVRRAVIIFGIAIFDALLPWFALALCGPGIIRYLDGLSEYAQSNADFAEIRHWADSLGEKGVAGEFVEVSQWPDSIKALSPDSVDLIAPGTVKMFWGGGLHGIVVGPENMSPPVSDDIEYRRLVRKGLYVWYKR